MAPLLPNRIAKAMLESAIERRNIRGEGIPTGPTFTSHEENILQILALTFAAVSVGSAFLAFYWFVRMRRTFRHHLIMLLIQSDMFKALWYMVYPIVVFCQGPVPSKSAFCQVNGFFLTLGIEASDFAILMIALHTALYIFKPRLTGEGGLYPYRRYAYALWIIFPILMASLAFVNNHEAYVSEGTYCYLPVRPFWYQLALGWIPRYIIFIFILGIYGSIYYYVRYKFHGFNKEGKANSYPANNSNISGPRSLRYSRTDVLPPTPILACHGLIPESNQPNTLNESNSWRTSRVPLRPLKGNKATKATKATQTTGTHRFMWTSFTHGPRPSTPPLEPLEPSTGGAGSFIVPSTPRPLPFLSPASASPRTVPSLSESNVESRATSWRDGFVRRFSPTLSGSPNTKHSFVSIFNALRRHPDSSGNDTPISQLQLVNSRGQTFIDTEMLRTRDKIRRQLRFLFIYPLFYMGMWIVPFASHVLQYNYKLAIDPPFALICLSTIFVCLQGAVDCWLFSTREKPWRHILKTEGNFWISLKFCFGWSTSSQTTTSHGPGKTREEMVRDASAAYHRRDEEMALRRAQVESAASQNESQRDVQRSWWEGIGVDGSMSATLEKGSHSMESGSLRREALAKPARGSSATLPKEGEDSPELTTLPRKCNTIEQHDSQESST